MVIVLKSCRAEISVVSQRAICPAQMLWPYASSKASRSPSRITIANIRPNGAAETRSVSARPVKVASASAPASSANSSGGNAGGIIELEMACRHEIVSGISDNWCESQHQSALLCGGRFIAVRRKLRPCNDSIVYIASASFVAI